MIKPGDKAARIRRIARLAKRQRQYRSIISRAIGVGERDTLGGSDLGDFDGAELDLVDIMGDV